MMARELTLAMGGRWRGNYGTARCPAHDDRTPSLSISESDGRLLVCCHAGCPQLAVLDALRARGLWPGRSSDAAPPAPRPSPPPPQRATLDARWRRLWGRCRPIDAADLAGQYLSARGCALPHPDGDLRWHPALAHPDGHVGPALVALVTDALSGEPISLHRTWIVGDGSSSKAAIDRPRLLLAGHRKTGGCIRLWPDSELGDALGIAEGIETGLSLGRVFWPVWALIDAGNLAALPLLPGVNSVTVAVDHDAAGLTAFAAVAERWTAAGREVRQVLPPIAGHDLNDWVRHAE